MENNQPLTMEAAQAEINRLRDQLAKKNKQPAPPTFKIGLESGEVEVHRLDSNMISLPVDVWEGLIKLAPKLIDFMLNNSHIIDRPGDGEAVLELKRRHREEAFTSAGKNRQNSIIRPKRAESRKDETKTVTEVADGAANG